VTLVSLLRSQDVPIVFVMIVAVSYVVSSRVVCYENGCG